MWRVNNSTRVLVNQARKHSTSECKTHTHEPPVHRFQQELVQQIPSIDLTTDLERRLAYGSDASFYRLIPQLVVHLHSEDEVTNILKLANKHKTPVTFRAAGTSLSGQAITDSILLKLRADKWQRASVIHAPDQKAKLIKMQPGLIGSEANRLLLPYMRKIGPDPSSIASCMVGGIVANNSSGMCCGVEGNAYNTIQDVRLVLADGSILDTADEESVARFRQSHAALLRGISDLHEEIHATPDLVARIRKKFKIKCTTGYSLNAFIDYHDPIEIIKHLVVGSEGTLSFISDVTLQSVQDHLFRSTCLILFPSIYDACRAARLLAEHKVVNAAELMDRGSLRSAEVQSATAKTGIKEIDMVIDEFLQSVAKLDEHAAGLLIEIRSTEDGETLAKQSGHVENLIQEAGIKTVSPLKFTQNPKLIEFYWDIRRGLVPLVGGQRKPGSTYLLEDFATDISNLADMGNDLKRIFFQYKYDDTVLFGHALDGNFHLSFSQEFGNQAEIDRYRHFMDDVCHLIVNKYDGSLKAEHGTGRNIAPFVQLEWGERAYSIMQRIKELFDPNQILNPGVILNSNPLVHLENIKSMVPVHPLIDKCIECGFCESVCPSRAVTVTPRQRIVVQREIARLEQTGEDPKALAELKKSFEYDGNETCAADGMCAEKCPVAINTGSYIKHLRQKQISSTADTVSTFIARHYQPFLTLSKFAFGATDVAHRVIGEGAIKAVNNVLGKLAPHGVVPYWNRYFPLPAASISHPTTFPDASPEDNRVVYFSSCVCRMMGPSRGSTFTQSTEQAMLDILKKANFQVIFPEKIGTLCCGLAFDSKGLFNANNFKAEEVMTVLKQASKNGKYPIICETSPCLLHLKDFAKSREEFSLLQFALFDPISFIKHHAETKLEWKQTRDNIVVHIPCSSKKMKISMDMHRLAKRCAKTVFDSEVSCCGMAGDRGMRYPELCDAANIPLKRLIAESPVEFTNGFSTSRTCEIQLSNQSDLQFSHLIHLINEATSPLPASSSASKQ